MKKSGLILIVGLAALAVTTAAVLWISHFRTSSVDDFSADPNHRLSSVTEAMVAIDDSPCAQQVAAAERAATCEERWKIFESSLPQCRNVVVSMSHASFFYEEEIVRVVDCFDKEKNSARALEIMKSATAWGEWQIDHGPTICPGESYVQASIEVREKVPGLCLKPDDLEAFLTAHSQMKNWHQFLDEAMRTPQLVMAGAWEADSHCVAQRVELLSVLTAAANDQGEWLVSQAPEEGMTYFVGMNPPLDFRVALSFTEQEDGCAALSNIDYNIPE